MKFSCNPKLPDTTCWWLCKLRPACLWWPVIFKVMSGQISNCLSAALAVCLFVVQNLFCSLGCANVAKCLIFFMTNGCHCSKKGMFSISAVSVKRFLHAWQTLLFWSVWLMRHIEYPYTFGLIFQCAHHYGLKIKMRFFSNLPLLKQWIIGQSAEQEGILWGRETNYISV